MAKSRIDKRIRDKIVTQALSEIEFARRHKEARILDWHKNENMYYGKKTPSTAARANVELGKMQEFVHTLLSKIDNPLEFKFIKNKAGQVDRVYYLNELKKFDSNRNHWNMKDLAGKKQAAIYGRAVFNFFADSHKGYTPHLENVDVYDFLIDPSAGGLDIEKASYVGHWGVSKTKSQLEQGVKDGLYMADMVKEITGASGEASGNADDKYKEDLDKDNRARATKQETTQKDMSGKDVYKFWQWFTTYEGERYYILMTPHGREVRLVKMEEIFKSGLYPYWTWATYLDLTEFWTPSPCDYVREIFMAQNVSINQMLDNAEQINKPTRVVNVSAITDLSDLKYRRDQMIRVTGNVPIKQAYDIVQTPSISTPIGVYNLLETIHEKASGVTAAEKGLSDQGGKATIYEGNQAAVADRFGLLNRSYTEGYVRFGDLYENGVREHLSQKIAIDILGPNGVEIEELGKSDIFRRGDQFGIIVEASDSDKNVSELEKRQKMVFLQQLIATQSGNIKKAMELQGKIVGYSDDALKQLLDTSETGSEKIVGEAMRDIEMIMEGTKLRPNRIADTTYQQTIVNYLQDQEERINAKQFEAISDYLLQIDEVVMQNMRRRADEEARKMMYAQMMQEATMGPQAGQQGPTTMGAGEFDSVNGGPQPAQPIVPPVSQGQLVNNINQQ